LLWFPCHQHEERYPVILFCLVVERLGEGTGPRVWQTLGWSVRLLTLRIVVEDQHRESRAVAGLGLFTHLLVTGRATLPARRHP
jgi:hypothetical protein